MTSHVTTKVMLEGKSRLPSRIQDIILNLGSVINNIQTSSGSNETLYGTLKNFAIMDPILENSNQNLIKIMKCLEKSKEQNNELDRSIIEV